MTDFFFTLKSQLTPLLIASLLSTAALAASPEALYVASLIEKAKTLKLSEDSQWRNLGFYEKGLFGGTSSRNSNAAFLGPDGSSNPEQELQATLEALLTTQERAYSTERSDGAKPETQIPRCQFPARYRWLKKVLAWDESKLPQVTCEHLDKFRTRMGVKSVSLVFSSFYLNNPSSSFGHTLIRVSRNPPNSKAQSSLSERVELLDFGFGFAAAANNSNPVLYAFNGLVGLVNGTYANIPYYYKVREYNNYEARDLWSYELNLTQDEMDMLVDRIWELGPVYHPYYFFTFNCGNVLLYALNVAAPRFKVLEGLKYYVIPSDVVKHVNSIPGLVSSVSYRPSAFSLFRQKYSKLDSKNREALESMISNAFDPSSTSGFSQEDKVQVLDSAADYLDYKFAKDLDNADSAAAGWRQTLLLARAEIPLKSVADEEFLPDESRPEKGHESSRITLLAGREQAFGNYLQANIRFSLHDFLDPPVGYPKFSQIEMMGAKLRYEFSNNRLEAEDLNFLRALSLFPVDAVSRNLSWRAELGGKRLRDYGSNRAFGLVGEGGAGFSRELLNGLVVYSLLEVSAAFAPDVSDASFKFGLGPSAGLILNQSAFALNLSGRYQYQFFARHHDSFELTSELRYHIGNKMMFGALGKVYPLSWDFGFQGFYFF